MNMPPIHSPVVMNRMMPWLLNQAFPVWTRRPPMRLNSFLKVDWSRLILRSSISCRLSMAARNTTRLTMAHFARHAMMVSEFVIRNGMAAAFPVSTSL